MQSTAVAFRSLCVIRCCRGAMFLARKYEVKSEERHFVMLFFYLFMKEGARLTPMSQLKQITHHC